MTPCTLVMAYYENADMLRHQYKLLSQLPAKWRDLIRVVIVDDGSPNNPAPKPPDDLDIAVQLYRMDVDVRWNQDACRNIGVRHAETNWVLMTDIDHVVAPATWNNVLFSNWDARRVYKFSRVSAPDHDAYKPHPNSWLMTRKTFDLVGGYDERFAGLYGTDADFRDRVIQYTGQPIQLDDVLIRYPRQLIADASTTTYLRKQPEDREGLARVRAERAALGQWTPKRFSFPYHRVYP